MLDNKGYRHAIREYSTRQQWLMERASMSVWLPERLYAARHDSTGLHCTPHHIRACYCPTIGTQNDRWENLCKYVNQVYDHFSWDVRHANRAKTPSICKTINAYLLGNEMCWTNLPTHYTWRNERYTNPIQWQPDRGF